MSTEPQSLSSRPDRVSVRRNSCALIAGNARDGSVDEAAVAAIRAHTTRGRYGWPRDMLIDMNAAALAAETRIALAVV